jgi:GT2 family glycosyltransferase
MTPSFSYYVRRLRRLFAGLPRRAYLTLRYHGLWETLFRIVTFPLRLTPWGHRLGLAARLSDPSAPARAWYTRHGRPVAVVIPTYGPTRLVTAAVKSVRRTTDASRVRVIVTDDGSAPDHVAALRRMAARRKVELVLGTEQRGFAANVNRGLRAAHPDEDVVLLNSDVVAHPGWLQALQHAAYEASAGIVGGRLLYPDETIQFGGMVRNPDHPEWFDHRFRFRSAEFPPAEVLQTTLAVTGACMYIKRETLDALGELDEAYGMAFEDVDYCVRAWDSGRRVLYAPAATLTHAESKTRGMTQGERELQSQAIFWNRWSNWFDRRDVADADGGLRIIYVTQDTGVGGGHRVIFTHLNGLKERGHYPELWTLARSGPDWFDLEVPVRSFRDYPALARALAPVDAIKVATWWETAPWVWEASVQRGIPVYLVQDIETTYYTNRDDHGRVLSTYRPEFEYLAGSEWVRDRLLEMVPSATTFTPGLDTERYYPLGLERSENALLALGRSNPLKNFSLTRAAYLALPEPRPELWLFGIEPNLANGLGPDVRYHEYPNDDEVNRLLNTTTVLLQTSRHEGFCLPALEGMAAGATIVCTDANGNRDFCAAGRNCLIPEASPRDVRDAVSRALTDRHLRRRLVENGFATAQQYAWPKKLDALDALYRDLAADRATGAPRRRARRA